MIQIKKVKILSAKVIASLSPHSHSEWLAMRSNRGAFYRMCKGLWVLYRSKTPLCVIGITPRSFLGLGAEVVLLLCIGGNQYTKELVKFIRRALRRMLHIFYSLFVIVEEGFWRGEKFVKFFGFRPLGDAKTVEAVTYRTYELRLSWL